MSRLSSFIKYSFLLFIFCGAISINLFARQQASGREKIQQAYSKLLALPQMQNGISSLTVLDAKTGEIVFSDKGSLGLATASTLKTITSATALHILGPDFRYKTSLFINGEIDDNGILQGDVIIQGSGDPTLGSHRYEETKEELILEKWVQALQLHGIKGINGRIIGDDRLFNGYQAPDGWPWADMGNYYGAGVSSLNWRENAFGVVFKPGKSVGDPTSISSTTADVSYLNIINEVKTGEKGSGDNVYAYSAPYSNKIFFRGEHGIDLQKTISMSIPDPAFDIIYQFSKRLEKAGIYHLQSLATAYNLSHDAKSFDLKEKDWKELAVHFSPTLDQIVYWFNRVSINLYGEALLKTIAVAMENGYETGAAARRESNYWVEQLGIPAGELKIVDGSGLSPNNRVSTQAMTKILFDCQKESWFPAYLDSFPVYNDMKMKSGTIGGVLGYTGYHTSTNGNSYVFAILVSNYHGGAQAMRNQLFSVLNSLK